MIIPYGYQAFGFKPQTILGLGFVVRRSGTDAEITATLVGVWSNVTYLEARNRTPELEARPERLTLEARNANLEYKETIPASTYGHENQR